MEEPRLYDTMEGQVALVTGANRGMGAVTAKALADLGATVYAGARSLRRRRGVSPRAEREGGARRLDGYDAPPGHVAVQLDVHDAASIAAALERVAEEAGRLDVLVNNAGIAPGLGTTLATEPIEQIDDVLATNLRGPMLVTKHALPLLLEREGGRVVNMSSGMGAFSEGMDSGEAAAYRISKAGLDALTAYLHAEFNESHGLIANALCPGWVRTDMGGPHAHKSPEEGADTCIWLSRFRPGSPSGLFWRDRAVIPW